MVTAVWSLFYFLTFASFLAALAPAWTRGSWRQAPLARKFTQASLALAAFLTAMVLSFAGFTLAPDRAPQIELFFDTVCLVIYGLILRSFAALLSELTQRPWSGLVRTTVEVLAGAGLVLPLVVHGLVWAPEPRLWALRALVNGVYLPVFLGALVLLFGRAFSRRGRLADPWKRVTLTGAVIIFAAGIPFFVADALWPWLQGRWRWLPRGANLHLVPFLAWNLFFAWRWTLFPSEALPVPEGPAAAPLPELEDPHGRLKVLTGREAEVAALLLAGQPNQAIADRLGLGLGTVKNHVYHIFNKTGASSRRELKEMVKTPGLQDFQEA